MEKARENSERVQAAIDGVLRTGFCVKKIEQICLGGNNKVFVLEDEEGERRLLKIYHRDDRQRLQREFAACRFLLEARFSVPAPLLRDEEVYFGLYSFEIGENRTADVLSGIDLDGAIDVLARLKTYTGALVDVAFDRAIMSQTSVREIFTNHDVRASEIESAFAEGGLDSEVVSFLNETDILRQLPELTQRILDYHGVSEWELADSELALSPGDVGIHNFLFRGAQLPCLIDLEYFGWDDPLKPMVDLVTHDKIQGISESLYTRAIERFIASTKISQEEQKRLHALIDAQHVNWIGIYLRSLGPARVAPRRHASRGDFDVKQYVSRQMQKLRDRYVKVKCILGE